MNKLGPEELCKAIFERLPLASFSCDPEGVVLAWNEAAERLYGYKKEDALGRKIVDLILLPDESDEEEDLIRQVFSGHELRGIKRSRRCADGHGLEVVTTFYPVRDLQGKVSRVVLVESKTADLSGAEALRESHERFLTVLDSLDSGVYVADMETYEILFANQKMRNYFGNIEGKTCWQVLQQGQSGPCDFCTNDKLLDTEGEPTGVYAWEFQNTINGFWCEIRDRAIRWVDGRMVRLEIAMDVTKRKRAEEALERERKAFRIIAEAAANAKDIPDLCQRVLEGFVDIMGFDSGAVRLYDEGKRILEAVAVTDMNEAKARSKPSPRSIDNLTHIPSIVARTRQAIFAPDVRGHEILKTHGQRLEELGIRSLITWPILGAGDRLLGVMHLVAGTPKEIPESHRVFFQTVAEMFATVLERKRAEQGINRHSRELSTLLEVSTEVSATLDEEEVTRLIAKRATELIGADGCTIYRFDPQTEELVPKTTTVLHDREKRLSCRLPLGEGITGKAALERRPILANNVHLDDSAIRIPGVEETPRCLLVAPLVAHGKLWGVMTLVRLSEEGFRERDLDLFALFANQVADAAVNSSLFSRLSESEEKYRSFVEQAIDGIVIIQDGRIVFANRAAADWGGYALDELIGMEFHHAAALGSREDMLNRYRRRMAGEQVPSVYETKLLARDGQMLDAELNAGIIQYQGRPAVLVFIRDIAERKRAEGALRESERRYRLLAQNVTDVIWTMNMELRFTYVSPSVESLLGYSVEEAMSLTMEEILTPVSFGLAEKIFAEEVAIEGMEQRDLKRSRILELEFNCKDGSRVWIEVKVGFLRDRDSQAVEILGVARDITERKRAEEALKESEEKYRNLVERANDGITIIQDTLLKYVNPRLPHLLGYSVEEMLNTPFTAYIDPEELPKVNERYRRRMAGEDVPSIYETIIRHKNGSKIYVEFNAGIVTYQGKPADLVFVRYITERKMAEEALRESEELYRILVNSAEEGICLVDSDERFLFVNPKMANLVGYDQEELMRKSLLELVPSDEVEFIRSESRRRMKGETSRYETTFIHKNGTPRKVLVNAAPIYDADGEFYAALGVLTDITDLKIVEDELRLRLIYQTTFAQIMNRAIGIENLDTFIQACLEILGNALDVNRVCLATNREVSKQREGVHPSAQEEPGAHVTHEWLGHGIKTLLGSEYPYSRIGYIHKRLKDDEITASLVSSLPEPDSRVFRDQGALSVIAAPIYLRSGFYGFIGVEECLVERRWRESEIEAFRTAVRLIVTVIDRYFEQQERRVAEEARARSEQRYRILVETSSDIIFLLSPSGKPLYGSPSVEKMGYKREDILREPKAFLKAIAPDDVVMLEALFAKALREGKPAHDIDCEIYDSQGRSHWFAVSWNFIRDDGGRIIAVQGVARDITERKQAERALRLRMEYEKVLFEISSLFLSEEVSDSSLGEFLERLGRVTEVSRVYLFSHEKENTRPFMKRIHRWVSEEASWLDNDRMDKVYYDQGFERWLKTLSTGEAIPGLTDDLPVSEREMFEAERIRAILVLPIFVEGRFWGAIGFDEAKRKREWNVEDIRLFWTASQILSSALATESKAKELALSYEDLQERERRISELNLRLVKAEEDERRRIARVLHDEIAQQLTGVSLTLSAPELARERKAQERLTEAKKMIKETQDFIRDLSYELLPPALDNLGLAAAVHALARSVAEGTGVSFVIQGDDDFPRADPDTEIMLYRIIQEAVANALKHADPEEITVRFEYDEPVLRVMVEDDGKGFDVEKIMSVSTGLGLRSIRERVALIGGRIELSSFPGRGTQLLVEVEIPRSSDKLSVEED